MLEGRVGVENGVVGFDDGCGNLFDEMKYSVALLVANNLFKTGMQNGTFKSSNATIKIEKDFQKKN
jgi:hypothetical protein